MNPTITLHNVENLNLSAIEHYPAEFDRPAFWTRTMTAKNKDGKSFSIGLFSNTPHGLVLPNELAAMPVCEPCESLASH